MKYFPQNFFPKRRRSHEAFTLIELLIVISIIVILAGLLVPVTGRIGVTRMKAVSKTELQQVAAAIEAYKAKYGFYPPDNATNKVYSALFYELSGTIKTNRNNPADPDPDVYETLDGRTVTVKILQDAFNVSGLANSSRSRNGTDEKPAPVNFLKELKPTQLGYWKDATNLICSQEWTKPGGTAANPWRYNSSNPTNNPGSYDLWVDLYIDGKTNRISNWSRQPEIVW
jgi:prepilin-type N-terminal cleavage/methylation domain-containing protein